MGADTAGGAWVRRSVLADQVYTEILARLMDGNLESGDPLSIDGTARDLGVSPTPVREALARLEATGMVVRAALRGYRVAPMLSHAELLDLMDARLLIEPHNAEMACLHADEAFLSELEHSIDDLRQAPNGPHFSDYRSYWEADERFHRLIAEQTRNRFLIGAYNSLGGHVHRFRLFGGTGVRDARSAIEEHGGIVAAMRRGNAAEAQAAMAAHLGGVRDRSVREHETAEHDTGRRAGREPA